MDANDIRPWTGSENGQNQHAHILGQMRAEVQSSGRQVVVLEKYRHAVDLEAEMPAEVDVDSLVYGETIVKCDVTGCGYVGVWRMGNDVMREFQAQKRKMERVRFYAAE